MDEYSQPPPSESYEPSSISQQQAQHEAGPSSDPADPEQYLPEDEISMEIRPLAMERVQRPTSIPR